MNAAETDPVRTKIIAAMDRLFEGKPLRSSGRLNISQLAVEADVPRWHLTHQHLDLKERFQKHVRNRGVSPEARRGIAGALEELRHAHRALQARCSELEEQNALYANAIQVLATELAGSDRPPRTARQNPRRLSSAKPTTINDVS